MSSEGQDLWSLSFLSLWYLVIPGLMTHNYKVRVGGLWCHAWHRHGLAWKREDTRDWLCLSAEFAVTLCHAKSSCQRMCCIMMYWCTASLREGEVSFSERCFFCCFLSANLLYSVYIYIILYMRIICNMYLYIYIHMCTHNIIFSETQPWGGTQVLLIHLSGWFMAPPCAASWPFSAMSLAIFQRAIVPE